MSDQEMKGELVGEVELKSGPDQFFKFWKTEPHNTATHSPSNIQACRLHEGSNWHSPGAIRIWDYTIDGKQEVFKDKVEVDEEKKLVKLTGLEGDVFKIYKVYNGIWHVVPKGEGYVAKVIIEYEKLSPNNPAPHNYLALLLSFTKDIDAALVNA